jgi:hypothetical protein
LADSIVLRVTTAFNMLGSWTEEIVCTRRKDGSFSLRVRRRGEDGNRSPPGKTGIRSPEVFIQTLMELGELTDLEISPGEIADEICPKLDQLDRTFSQAVKAYIRERHR